MSLEFWSAAQELSQSRESFVVVTLLAVRGYAPQSAGAKAIVTARGLHWGTVGGGKVEAMAIEKAGEILRQNTSVSEPQLVTWNLQRDVGMTCGGEVTYLFEPTGFSQRRVVIFGAGHVAQALSRVLDQMDCLVDCVDSREEWLARLPVSAKLRAVRVESLETLGDASAPFWSTVDARCTFIVMTRGHATDYPIVREICLRFPDAPYIGCIGSEVKALKIRNDLKADGVTPDVIERLYCPMGLKIGGNNPGEIAVSIAAQLLSFSRHDR